MSHALASSGNMTDKFSNVDHESLQTIVDLQIAAKSKGWVEWVRNPSGPPRPGFWVRAALAIYYVLNVGVWNRFRASRRIGTPKFLSNPPTKIDLHKTIVTTPRTVSIGRADLNRNFSASKIIRASEDTFGLMLHETGIAHLELFFGRMYYSSGIKAKFVKEMPENSTTRTEGSITGIRGPLMDVLVKFVEVRPDGSTGVVAFEVVWSLLMVVDIDQKLVYNFETVRTGVEDFVGRRLLSVTVFLDVSVGLGCYAEAVRGNDVRFLCVSTHSCIKTNVL